MMGECVSRRCQMAPDGSYCPWLRTIGLPGTATFLSWFLAPLGISEIFASHSTMSSNDLCSGNNDSCWLGSYCHVPVTSSTALYLTGVNCGDALHLPSRNKTWLPDNSPETCDKLSSYQPSSCEPTTYKTSHYSSTT